MLGNTSSFFSRILPKPTQEDDDENVEETKTIPAPIIATIIAPPYGQRKGWIPRNQEVFLFFISVESSDCACTHSYFFLQDFGDGGAFPEIIVSQYPLNMGRPNNKSSSNAIAVQLDAEGRVKYDVLARQGHRPDKVSITFNYFMCRRHFISVVVLSRKVDPMIVDN